MTELTDKGYAFAKQEAAEGSIVARVALLAALGEAESWPEAFQETAITAMNEAGEIGARA